MVSKMNNFNFFTLTSIQTGIYVCVSAIMVGHILLTKFGLHTALISLAIGSMFLWISALIFARISFLRKKVLVDLVSDYFGKRGAQVCGVAFAASLLGWFAIQLEMISKGVHNLFPQIPVLLGDIVFGALITFNVLRGIKSIGRLADFSMPFLLCTMIFIFIRSYSPDIHLQLHAIAPKAYDYLGAISFIIAASIGGVIDTPTYFCESRSQRDSYIAVTLVYVIILPLITMMGIFLGICTGVDDFILSIMSLGGSTWKMMMLIFLIIAGWTTNNGNLYSACVALGPCCKSLYKTRVLCLGFAGIGLAYLEIVEHFVEGVGAMSIMIGALGAGLLVRFISTQCLDILPNKIEQKRYIFMILLGSSIGFLNVLGVFNLTESGFLDAFLVTAVAAFLYEVGKKCITK
jgi:cytosine permease